jgi:hypothetical protein
LSDPNAPYRGAPWLTNRDAEIAGEIMGGGPVRPRPPSPEKLRRLRKRRRIRAIVSAVIAFLFAVNTAYDGLTGQVVTYSLGITVFFALFAFKQARRAAAMSIPEG